MSPGEKVNRSSLWFYVIISHPIPVLKVASSQECEAPPTKKKHMSLDSPRVVRVIITMLVND